jgi:hypothetical protein
VLTTDFREHLIVSVALVPAFIKMTETFSLDLQHNWYSQNTSVYVETFSSRINFVSENTLTMTSVTPLAPVSLKSTIDLMSGHPTCPSSEESYSYYNSAICPKTLPLLVESQTVTRPESLSWPSIDIAKLQGSPRSANRNTYSEENGESDRDQIEDGSDSMSVGEDDGRSVRNATNNKRQTVLERNRIASNRWRHKKRRLINDLEV